MQTVFNLTLHSPKLICGIREKSPVALREGPKSLNQEETLERLTTLVPSQVISHLMRSNQESEVAQVPLIGGCGIFPEHGLRMQSLEPESQVSLLSLKK